MSNVDKSYCECIGLYDDVSTQLRGAESTPFRAMLKGMIPNQDKQILVNLNKDNGGGDGGDGGGKSDGGGNKSDGGGNDNGKNNRNNDNDDKKNNGNKNDDDDKKRKNDDDDKKNKDDDDDKKRKNDDDDDKKNKDDDDDDDKKSRNITVPECTSGGKNYLRCDPATVKSSDKETCNAIKKEVCGKDMSSVDKSYCECIGLDGKETAFLRGIMKVSL
jgi:hypothetical protein